MNMLLTAYFSVLHVYYVYITAEERMEHQPALRCAHHGCGSPRTPTATALVQRRNEQQVSALAAQDLSASYMCL